MNAPGKCRRNSRVDLHARSLCLAIACLIGACASAASVRAQDPEGAAPRENWDVFRGSADGRGYRESPLPETLGILWQHEIPNGAFESTPIIHNDVLYIGDMDGKFLALDLATGAVQWETSSELGYLAAAAWCDDRIFVGNQEGIFYCLDARDGKTIWTYEAGAIIDAGANFHGDNVIFGSQDASLYCLSRENGTLVWQHTIDDQIRCSPTIVDGKCLVAGCDGRLHIIDAATGKATGAVQIDSPTGVTPAALGSRVYFGTEQAGFYSVDVPEMKLAWRFEDPDGVASIRSCPATADGHVVFGSQNRKVHSLDPGTGAVNWTFEARGGVDSSPIIAGERVYVGGTDSRMYVLSLKDGTRISERELNGKIIGSPAVSKGRLVIATSRGIIYCLGQKEEDRK